jgi:hypothetical protein
MKQVFSSALSAYNLICTVIGTAFEKVDWVRQFQLQSVLVYIKESWSEHPEEDNPVSVCCCQRQFLSLNQTGYISKWLVHFDRDSTLLNTLCV